MRTGTNMQGQNMHACEKSVPVGGPKTQPRREMLVLRRLDSHLEHALCLPTGLDFRGSRACSPRGSPGRRRRAWRRPSAWAPAGRGCRPNAEPHRRVGTQRGACRQRLRRRQQLRPRGAVPRVWWAASWRAVSTSASLTPPIASEAAPTRGRDSNRAASRAAALSVDVTLKTNARSRALCALCGQCTIQQEGSRQIRNYLLRVTSCVTQRHSATAIIGGGRAHR